MISVVIPCFDAGRFLRETLACLRAQTRPPDEVVIVDDGSTDRATLRLLERLPPGVRLLRQQNRGPGAARNLGVRESRGELILPLDDDDLLAPDALARFEQALRDAPAADFAYAHVEQLGAARGVVTTPRFNPWLQTQENALGPTALLRRRMFTEHRLAWPDLRAYEDWSFWLAAAEAGLDGVAVEAPLYRYRRKGRSGRMAAGLRSREELQAAVRALHPRSFSADAQAELKLRFAPALEILWSGPERDGRLGEWLSRQQLDDLAVRAGPPATAHELLTSASGRFLLPLAPAQLERLAPARASLLDLAVRALAAQPAAGALVVPTDRETIEAQARCERLCPWPPARPLAPGDLLFARTAAFARLAPGELREGRAAGELLASPLGAGRGLLLGHDFLGLLAARQPPLLEPLPPLQPPQRPPPSPGYRAWRLWRGAMVALAGEERVAAALQPIKTALFERRRVRARDQAWAADLARPPALPASRRRELELLEAAAPRSRRRIPLAPPPGRARVALVTHWLTTGGVERALIDLAAALPRDRYELIAVTTLRGRHPWAWRMWPQVDEVVHLDAALPPEAIPAALVDLLAGRAVRGLLTVNSWEGYAAAQLARGRLPGLRTMDYQHTDFQESGGDFARVSCTRYAGALDLRAVSTEYLRRRYATYGVDPAAVRVIRAGCDEEQAFHPDRVAPGRLRARLGIPAGAPLVGFVGRMEPEKDPLFVASVYQELARRVPGARFVFLGEGSLLAPVQALAARAPLAGRVSFLPAETEVAEVLRDLTVLLMASRLEGLPLVFFEAMALRTPVISTAIEGIPELVAPGAGACVANAADPEERRRLLVEAALPVLGDPALRERWGAAARARIEGDFASARTRAAWRQAFADLVGDA